MSCFLELSGMFLLFSICSWWNHRHGPHGHRGHCCWVFSPSHWHGLSCPNTSRGEATAQAADSFTREVAFKCRSSPMASSLCFVFVFVFSYGWTVNWASWRVLPGRICSHSRSVGCFTTRLFCRSGLRKHFGRLRRYFAHVVSSISLDLLLFTETVQPVFF